ncbi:interleukin 4 receptor, tandem duplicate 1 [Tachysurus vachellii]|uniref:interleukin 4 receptor, tandem duplicate 1 n=1 Tax=Tachysurus vachellii TaxID=175792 RepID=UPI00296AE01F|nr:interleukin 4 receptor, tandem duplicate 1 [Tachysurus vachellii]
MRGITWKSFYAPPIRAGAIILILQLGLVISFNFTESSGDYTSAEPKMDLQCLHDYITEMMCSLTADQLLICPEYSLNVSVFNAFTCDLKQLNSNSCECTVHVDSGFVSGENYKVKVLRNKNLLFTTNFSTTENIKPNKPVIMTVNETENGNFLIAWDTIYRTKEPIFSEDLISELTYYIEGSKGTRKNVTVSAKGRFAYELVGRNLEPNSNYIVMARIQSHLNDRFSDYSDPYRFSTPSSLKDYVKIIIPLICITLIISISVTYYLCNKILIDWWDKIPTPKIATSFVKQVPNLLSFQSDFSTIHLDASKLLHSGDKIWPASSPVDVRGENNSLNSFGKDRDSSGVSYSQTVIQSIEENSPENNTHGKESPSTISRMPTSTRYYKNLKSLSDDSNVVMEYGSSSDFNNKPYMFSLPEKIHNDTNGHYIYDLNQRESMFPSLEKNLDPMIQTDLEYVPCTPCTPCTGSSGSENVTPSSSEIIMVNGYQSLNNILDHASKPQSFISPHNDVYLITEKIICSKNAHNISYESPIIPVENEYRDFHSLLQNSNEQHSLVTGSELKQLYGLDLQTSPGIEIDCSYHRV